MAQIVNTYPESCPALVPVGKCCTDADRDQYGTYGAKWGQWFSNGWFDRLESCGIPHDGSYVGAMRITQRGFEYWIGMLMQQTRETGGFDAVPGSRSLTNRGA